MLITLQHKASEQRDGRSPQLIRRPANVQVDASDLLDQVAPSQPKSGQLNEDMRQVFVFFAVAQ